MSKLKFDGVAHHISLIDSSDNTVGTWAAYNNVDSRATIRHVANGSYTVQDQTAPHQHIASANGPYGLHGIVRFNVTGHPELLCGMISGPPESKEISTCPYFGAIQ